MSKRFKADITALRQRLNKRAASLKRARQAHESTWKEIAENFEPQFGRPLAGITANAPDDTASRNDGQLINSHPRSALSRLGAGMQGGITSPASKWFTLTTAAEGLRKRPDVTAWLDDVTRTMVAAFSTSNIYTVLHQMYLHLGCFGTAAALIVPDDDHVLHAILLDEGSYWIASDKRGLPSTLLRAFSYTAAQIEEEFGREAIDEDQALKDSIDHHRGEDSYVVWHLVEPNTGKIEDVDAKQTYVSYYWREGASSGLMLAIRSYNYKPIVAPRWHVLAGAYGFGPGHMALGDAKELQKLELDLLQAIAKSVDPPMTAPEEMRDEPINTFPGAITYRRDGGMDGDRRPSLAPLYEIRLDISALREQIVVVEGRIDRNFFTDLFAMMLQLNTRPKVMTAREVIELSQEKMALLGPVLTRMNSDMLEPLIDAAFANLLSAEVFPPPPEILANQPLTVKYLSVLHIEQQSTSRLGAMIRLFDFVGMAAQVDPVCLDKIDTIEAVTEAAEVLDVPARVMRSTEAVAAIQQQRAAAQQQQQMMEAAATAAPGAARAARDMAETPMNTGSALDGLLQGMQQ